MARPIAINCIGGPLDGQTVRMDADDLQDCWTHRKGGTVYVYELSEQQELVLVGQEPDPMAERRG